jgi:hypothetical protein
MCRRCLLLPLPLLLLLLPLPLLLLPLLQVSIPNLRSVMFLLQRIQDTAHDKSQAQKST